MDETRTMKVGEVAEAAGLTVRTLHHWDSIGLLSPSERSPAGHREYTQADLVRLYQVLALRSLGLGLESIVAGIPLDDPQAQRLVARIDELGAWFSGGDRDISAGVRAAWADDPAGLSNVRAEQATGWRDLSRYLDLARQMHTKEQEHA
jgi:DNA-binding transcriptional MerR regulator